MCVVPSLFVFLVLDILNDGLSSHVPWAFDTLLGETSIYTSLEEIVLYMKSERPKKCIFSGKNDRGLKLVPCREDEPICCDESSDQDGPFCYFYTTVFKKVLLRLPLYNFKKELLTEINIASSQLHPNSWAFVQGFSILYTYFDHLPSVEVFLYFFEAKRLGHQLWVSFNGVVGRVFLSLFQQSYKGFKGKFLKTCCNKKDPTLLHGFPLYWTEKSRFQGARCLDEMPQREREVCLFLSSLKVVFDIATLIDQEFSQVGLKAYIGISHSCTLAGVDLHVYLPNPCFLCRQHAGYTEQEGPSSQGQKDESCCPSFSC